MIFSEWFPKKFYLLQFKFKKKIYKILIFEKKDINIKIKSNFKQINHFDEIFKNKFMKK